MEQDRTYKTVAYGACGAAIVATILAGISLYRRNVANRKIALLEEDVARISRAAEKQLDFSKELARYLNANNQRMVLTGTPDGTYHLEPLTPGSSLPAPSNLDELRASQTRARESLIGRTCGEIPLRQPLHEAMELVEKRDSYDLYRLALTTRIGGRKSAALAVPNVPGVETFPAAVVFRGTGGHGESELAMFDEQEFAAFNRDMFHENYTYPLLFLKREFGKQKYVVLAMDCVYDAGDGPELRKRVAAEGLAALDFLESMPQVDESRIGCAGLSAGAGHALMLAGLDDRVRAVLAYGTPLSGDRDTMLAIAPRPVIVGNGFYDFECMPVRAAAEIASLRKAYELLGHPENLVSTIHPGEHLFYGDDALEIFDAFMNN